MSCVGGAAHGSPWAQVLYWLPCVQLWALQSLYATGMQDAYDLSLLGFCCAGVAAVAARWHGGHLHARQAGASGE